MPQIERIKADKNKNMDKSKAGKQRIRICLWGLMILEFVIKDRSTKSAVEGRN